MEQWAYYIYLLTLVINMYNINAILLVLKHDLARLREIAKGNVLTTKKNVNYPKAAARNAYDHLGDTLA